MHGTMVEVRVLRICAFHELFRELFETYVLITSILSYRVKEVHKMFYCVTSSIVELMEL